MKKILLLLMFSYVGYSQNRQDDVMPTISDILGRLSNASGFHKISTGKWIERKNKIIADRGSHTLDLENYEESSLGKDNFKQLKLNKIIINDSIFFMITKEYFDGYYYYPNLREDWRNSISQYCYIFNQKEFNKIKLLKKDEWFDITLKPNYFIELRNVYNETQKQINDEIFVEIKDKTNKILNKDFYLVLSLNNISNKNIIDFYFFNYRKTNNEYIDNKEFLEKTNRNFYYEMSIDLFNKFIKIE